MQLQSNHMKKITLVLLFFTAQIVQSQVRSIAEQGSGIVNLERHQVTLNLINPGISYEIGLFRNVSASGSTGFGLASYDEGYVFGYAYIIGLGIIIILIDDWIWVKMYPGTQEIILPYQTPFSFHG